MDINKILSQMRQSGRIQKGEYGEDAVFQIVAAREGPRLLYNSYSYPYQTDRSGKPYPGNLHYKEDTGKFTFYDDEMCNDEIDELYITPYRIFVIEVKSYRSSYIDLYDHWASAHGKPVNKNPVLQNEKHCRMLYHMIHEVIPDGKPDYIVPITCFVDRCKIRDDRSPYWQEKYPVCILNALTKTITKYDTPLEYNLDLKTINSFLHQKAISIKKEAD